MCRLSWNLGSSTPWNPQVLSRPVQGLLQLYLLQIFSTESCGEWWDLTESWSKQVRVLLYEVTELQRYLLIRHISHLPTEWVTATYVPCAEADEYSSIDTVNTGLNGEWETSVIFACNRKTNADCCIHTVREISHQIIKIIVWWPRKFKTQKSVTYRFSTKDLYEPYR
jgi:hypothetical protein